MATVTVNQGTFVPIGLFVILDGVSSPKCLSVFFCINKT